jgi:DNA replication protein DnaC
MQTAFEDLTIEQIMSRAIGNSERRASEGAVAEIERFFKSCGYLPHQPDLYRALCRLGASELEHTSCRGMILKGDPGIGKTLGLELLAKKFKWHLVTAREVLGFYATDPDFYEWENYCRALNFYEEPQTLVIDDLGTEKFPFIHYGQQANPLEELLEIRYRQSFSRDRVRTIITCNLTDEEIRRRYGFRIADRINEMYAVFTFRGKSLRG